MSVQLDTWRAEDTNGAVHVAPEPARKGSSDWWFCAGLGLRTPRAAVAWWCETRKPPIDWVEILEPGQVSRAEAERARIVAHVQHEIRAAEKHQTAPVVVETLRELLKRIESGEVAT